MKKEKAIKLRKRGLSYREILEEVPVAKSTLSIWLRNVGLSKTQKQRLTKKKLEAARRGAEARKRQKIERTQKIITDASNQVGKISRRELWFMGVMLYWAEGSKEKSWGPGTGVRFSNSDPLMVSLFLKWLKDICRIDENEIRLDIYIHENSIYKIPEIKRYWSDELKLPKELFRKVYLKRHKLSTRRKNIGRDYHGLVSVRVKRSTDLNRKFTGWTEGICKEILRS